MTTSTVIPKFNTGGIVLWGQCDVYVSAVVNIVYILVA